MRYYWYELYELIIFVDSKFPPQSTSEATAHATPAKLLTDFHPACGTEDIGRQGSISASKLQSQHVTTHNFRDLLDLLSNFSQRTDFSLKKTNHCGAHLAHLSRTVKTWFQDLRIQHNSITSNYQRMESFELPLLCTRQGLEASHRSMGKHCCIQTTNLSAPWARHEITTQCCSIISRIVSTDLLLLSLHSTALSCTMLHWDPRQCNPQWRGEH